MGRELRRVSPDFNWPVNKVWEGFLNPFYKHHHKCLDCDGGYNKYGQKLHDQWYGYVEFDARSIGAEPLTIDNPYLHQHVIQKINRDIEFSKIKGESPYYTKSVSFDVAVEREKQRMVDVFGNSWHYQLCQEDVDALVEKDQLWDLTHRLREDQSLEDFIRTRAYYLWIEAGHPESNGIEFWEKAAEEFNRRWLPFPNGYKPTAEEVNGRAMIDSFLLDSCSAYTCIEARAKREGKTFLCESCDGSGKYWESPEWEKKAEEWEPIEPPTGEAYQIWETVTEGSPVSPPFLNPEDLAEWMVKNDTSITKSNTKKDWMEFILGPGWAPSAVLISGSGFVDGVKANSILNSQLEETYEDKIEEAKEIISKIQDNLKEMKERGYW